MAMANALFGITLRDALDTTGLAINLQADSFKKVLVLDAYTPDANAHDFYADITNELVGAGYTAAGKVVTTPTLVVSGGFLTWDMDDTSWTGATFASVRGEVMIDDTVASDPLICAKTYGADYGVTAGTFTVQENASGLIRIALT